MNDNVKSYNRTEGVIIFVSSPEIKFRLLGFNVFPPLGDVLPC